MLKLKLIKTEFTSLKTKLVYLLFTYNNLKQ